VLPVLLAIAKKKREEIIGSLLAYWTSGRYSSGIDVVP